ncbi:MAG: hypothetical protein G01um101420_32 [Parcubacteria group bacterium Gr01-1014_20]|nr:MAG: hypothetical protein G01um101420_32 [Parcubacteria group bacterium Gr01-1014_20]
MRIKINVDLRVGRVIKYFILADLALLAGWGLVGPIFSVFVIERVAGATLVTVGIAAGIYWVLKSLLQLPIATYLDKKEGERDDFLALIIGLFVSAFTAIAYNFITQVWHLYLVEIIHAMAFALYVPAWSAMFSRHVDKDRVSFDWSLDSTVAGLSAGVSGILGGAVASAWGFHWVFILAGIFSAVSAFVLIMAPDFIFPPRTTENPVIKDHTPANISH